MNKVLQNIIVEPRINCNIYDVLPNKPWSI